MKENNHVGNLFSYRLYFFCIPAGIFDNVLVNTIFSKGSVVMKATGIVRRLDDLGRLVIPKEIRKQYRLKEGDSIEFFTENDRILIQKFDVMSKNIEEICIMCETLQAMYQNTVLFIQEEWLQRNQYHLQEEFVRLTHVHRVCHFEGKQVFQDMDKLHKGIIYPITAYGDWYGAFVVLLEKREVKEEEYAAMEAFAQLLARQQMK